MVTSASAIVYQENDGETFVHTNSLQAQIKFMGNYALSIWEREQLAKDGKTKNKQVPVTHLGVSINIRVPPFFGWFQKGKSQSRMDDSGVPPSVETLIYK